MVVLLIVVKKRCCCCCRVARNKPLWILWTPTDVVVALWKSDKRKRLPSVNIRCKREIPPYLPSLRICAHFESQITCPPSLRPLQIWPYCPYKEFYFEFII